MAARRGNKSTYSSSVYDPPRDGKLNVTDFRDFSDNDFIEAWKRARQRDPFVGLYDRLKNMKPRTASLNCLDLCHALEFLHEATGDDAFQAAVLAMKRHGFTSSGVKKTVLGKMSLQKHAAWAAMPKVHAWIESEEISAEKAAKFVAAQRGIYGDNFFAVVTELRKTYPKWLKSIRPAPEVGKTL